MSEKFKSVDLSGLVSSNSTEFFIKEMEGNASLEELMVRLYDGPEGELKVYPKIWGKSPIEYDESDIQDQRLFIEFVGNKTFIFGNNDIFEYELDDSIKDGYYVGLKVVNDTSYDYDVRSILKIDYRGGLKTMKDKAFSLLDMIKGVF